MCEIHNKTHYENVSFGRVSKNVLFSGKAFDGTASTLYNQAQLESNGAPKTAPFALFLFF